MPVYKLELDHGHYFRPPPRTRGSLQQKRLPSRSQQPPAHTTQTLSIKTQISIPPKYSSSQNGYIGPIATSRLSAKTGDSLAQAQFPLELSRTRVMEQRCLSFEGMAQRNKRR